MAHVPAPGQQHTILDPRRYITPGVKQALHAVIDEMAVARRHRRGTRALRGLRADGDLKLNVGCGPKPKPGWVNIDLFATGGGQIPLDLRRELPFATSSASIVYGEHVFEHLGYPGDAQHFLGEALRILKPGGVLSIGVPDVELVLRAYVADDASHFQFSHRWHPDWCDTHLHQVNYTFRQGSEHKYAYDHETLAKVVADAGFVDVMRRDYDPDLDSEERSVGTLYIDARKPY
ncbi:MAG: class I SAM-dependent methyltransferase [Acetobacteraceae bacterium]